MTPVLIDLETRSACDLRAEGGANYALAPSTRLMTVSWSADGGNTYSVWLPGESERPAQNLLDLHLPGITVYCQDTIPTVLCRLAHRPWAAHNSASFDALVWRECAAFEPVEWVDTYPLALSVGLPGGLDRVGRLLGYEGKDKAGKLVLHSAMKCKGEEDCDPENVPIVQRLLIAKYNVQDVKLLADLWRVLEREAFKQPEEENRVRRLDRVVNDRGVRIDRKLIEALQKLDGAAKADAERKIAKLTNGKLNGMGALQSRNTMLSWLDFMGLNNWKTLKKDFVARWIDANTSGDWEDNDDDGIPTEEEEEFGAGITPVDLPRVARVLELRSTALRVTSGKLAAALSTLGGGHIARNLLVYWGAHTGRWAARRIQPHNFPRPKPGVNEWALLDLYYKTGALDFDAVSALCDPADAASALLRAMIVPTERTEKVMAADLSQIEARMLAWLAGDTPAMQLFWSGDDPYMVMAQRICGPKEGWPDEGVPYKKHSYRQLVGKVPELACGYQGGERAVASYCAMLGFRMEDFGLTPLDAVLAYRRLHPAIAGEEKEWDGRVYFRGGLWDQYNDAAILACDRGGPVPVGPVDFQREGKHLIVVLPSGRRLTYRNAEVESQLRFGKEGPCVRFDHPRFGRKAGYPGLWAENITQGASRDVIAHGMLGAEEGGAPVLLTVHDEVVSSAPECRFPAFMSAVSTCPEWLPNFPLDCEGAYGIHYTKAAKDGETKYRNGRVR